MRHGWSASVLVAAALGLTVPACVCGQGKVLRAAFTPAPVAVDANRGAEWEKAAPQPIAICMNPALKAHLGDCNVTGTVQALWSGPTLYLLFTVTDPDVSTANAAEGKRSGVEMFVDQYNDRFPKFEEDDSYVVIGADGKQTGNRTNADLKY